MIESVELTTFGDLTTAIYATVATLLLGGIVKFFNNMADSGKYELETHFALRKELREELDSVKEELQRLQIDLDEWKQKYYNQVELTSELKLSIIKLNDELMDHKQAHNELVNKYESCA
jgi:chromosome segregation ATPase